MKLNLPYGLMAAALGLSMMTACGPDDDNNETDSITAEQAIDRAAAAVVDFQCKNIFQCPEKQGLSLIVLGRFKSEADCKATLTKEFILDNELKASIDAGRITYDATSAQVCITKLEETTSKAICNDESDNALGEEPAECDQTFKGTIAAGGKCLDDDECVAGLECDTRGSDTCYGTCKVDPCASCTDTQACIGDGQGNYSCKDTQAIGASCLTEDLCVDGASCFYSDDETATCIADESVDNGAACSRDNQCKSGSCNDSICEAQPAAPPLGAAGEGCTLFGKLCKPGLSCQDFDFIAQTGTCKTVAAKGADCDISMQCEYGLFCQGADPGMTKGKCAEPLADGQTCEDDDNCKSDSCDEDTNKCVSAMMCSI